MYYKIAWSPWVRPYWEVLRFGSATGCSWLATWMVTRVAGTLTDSRKVRTSRASSLSGLALRGTGGGGAQHSWHNPVVVRFVVLFWHPGRVHITAVFTRLSLGFSREMFVGRPMVVDGGRDSAGCARQCRVLLGCGSLDP